MEDSGPHGLLRKLDSSPERKPCLLQGLERLEQVLQGLGVDPSSCVQTSVVTFASLRPVDLEVGQLEALLPLQVLRVPGLLQDRPLGLVQGPVVPQAQELVLLEVVQEVVAVSYTHLTLPTKA